MSAPAIARAKSEAETMAMLHTRQMKDERDADMMRRLIR